MNNIPWFNNNYRGRGKRSRGWNGNNNYRNWRAPHYNQNHNFPFPNAFHQQGFRNSFPVPGNFNPRHRFPQPVYHEKPFRSPPPLQPAISPPHSPLPGTEEYRLRSIQQKSELIKRQLNLNSEGGGDLSDFSQTTSSVSEGFSEQKVGDTKEPISVQPTCSESYQNSIRSPKVREKPTKRSDAYNVQEVRDKIISHISNLNYGKKMNLINVGSTGYDEAIQQIQKNERLEVIRALRDMCDPTTEDRSEVISSIMPDIGIKLNDLPAEFIRELSSTLDLTEDELLEENNPNIDPEMLFKQAEDMLSMDFLDSSNVEFPSFSSTNESFSQVTNDNSLGSHTDGVASQHCPPLDPFISSTKNKFSHPDNFSSSPLVNETFSQFSSEHSGAQKQYSVPLGSERYFPEENFQPALPVLKSTGFKELENIKAPLTSGRYLPEETFQPVLPVLKPAAFNEPGNSKAPSESKQYFPEDTFEPVLPVIQTTTFKELEHIKGPLESERYIPEETFQPVLPVFEPAAKARLESESYLPEETFQPVLLNFEPTAFKELENKAPVESECYVPDKTLEPVLPVITPQTFKNPVEPVESERYLPDESFQPVLPIVKPAGFTGSENNKVPLIVERYLPADTFQPALPITKPKTLAQSKTTEITSTVLPISQTSDQTKGDRFTIAANTQNNQVDTDIPNTNSRNDGDCCSLKKSVSQSAASLGFDLFSSSFMLNSSYMNYPRVAPNEKSNISPANKEQENTVKRTTDIVIKQEVIDPLEVIQKMPEKVEENTNIKAATSSNEKRESSKLTERTKLPESSKDFDNQSEKRLSLDERLKIELGITTEHPKHKDSRHRSSHDRGTYSDKYKYKESYDRKSTDDKTSKSDLTGSRLAMEKRKERKLREAVEHAFTSQDKSKKKSSIHLESKEIGDFMKKMHVAERKTSRSPERQKANRKPLEHDERHRKDHAHHKKVRVEVTYTPRSRSKTPPSDTIVNIKSEPVENSPGLNEINKKMWRSPGEKKFLIETLARKSNADSPQQSTSEYTKKNQNYSKENKITTEKIIDDGFCGIKKIKNPVALPDSGKSIAKNILNKPEEPHTKNVTHTSVSAEKNAPQSLKPKTKKENLESFGDKATDSSIIKNASEKCFDAKNSVNSNLEIKQNKKVQEHCKKDNLNKANKSNLDRTEKNSTAIVQEKSVVSLNQRGGARAHIAEEESVGEMKQNVKNKETNQKVMCVNETTSNSSIENENPIISTSDKELKNANNKTSVIQSNSAPAIKENYKQIIQEKPISEISYNKNEDLKKQKGIDSDSNSEKIETNMDGNMNTNTPENQASDLTSNKEETLKSDITEDKFGTKHNKQDIAPKVNATEAKENTKNVSVKVEIDCENITKETKIEEVDFSQKEKEVAKQLEGTTDVSKCHDPSKKETEIQEQLEKQTNVSKIHHLKASVSNAKEATSSERKKGAKEVAGTKDTQDRDKSHQSKSCNKIVSQEEDKQIAEEKKMIEVKSSSVNNSTEDSQEKTIDTVFSSEPYIKEIQTSTESNVTANELTNAPEQDQSLKPERTSSRSKENQDELLHPKLSEDKLSSVNDSKGLLENKNKDSLENENKLNNKQDVSTKNKLIDNDELAKETAPENNQSTDRNKIDIESTNKEVTVSPKETEVVTEQLENQTSNVPKVQDYKETGSANEKTVSPKRKQKKHNKNKDLGSVSQKETEVVTEQLENQTSNVPMVQDYKETGSANEKTFSSKRKQKKHNKDKDWDNVSQKETEVVTEQLENQTPIEPKVQDYKETGSANEKTFSPKRKQKKNNKDKDLGSASQKETEVITEQLENQTPNEAQVEDYKETVAEKPKRKQKKHSKDKDLDSVIGSSKNLEMENSSKVLTPEGCKQIGQEKPVSEITLISRKDTEQKKIINSKILDKNVCNEEIESQASELTNKTDLALKGEIKTENSCNKEEINKIEEKAMKHDTQDSFTKSKVSEKDGSTKNVVSGNKESIPQTRKTKEIASEEANPPRKEVEADTKQFHKIPKIQDLKETVPKEKRTLSPKSRQKKHSKEKDFNEVEEKSSRSREKSLQLKLENSSRKIPQDEEKRNKQEKQLSETDPPYTAQDFHETTTKEKLSSIKRKQKMHASKDKELDEVENSHRSKSRDKTPQPKTEKVQIDNSEKSTPHDDENKANKKRKNWDRPCPASKKKQKLELVVHISGKDKFKTHDNIEVEESSNKVEKKVSQKDLKDMDTVDSSYKDLSVLLGKPGPASKKKYRIPESGIEHTKKPSSTSDKSITDREIQTKHTLKYTVDTQTDCAHHQSKHCQTEIASVSVASQTNASPKSHTSEYQCEMCAKYKEQIVSKNNIINLLLKLDEQIQNLFSKRKELCTQLTVLDSTPRNDRKIDVTHIPLKDSSDKTKNTDDFPPSSSKVKAEASKASVDRIVEIPTASTKTTERKRGRPRKRKREKDESQPVPQQVTRTDSETSIDVSNKLLTTDNGQIEELAICDTSGSDIRANKSKRSRKEEVKTEEMTICDSSSTDITEDTFLKNRNKKSRKLKNIKSFDDLIDGLTNTLTKIKEAEKGKRVRSLSINDSSYNNVYQSLTKRNIHLDTKYTQKPVVSLNKYTLQELEMLRHKLTKKEDEPDEFDCENTEFIQEDLNEDPVKSPSVSEQCTSNSTTKDRESETDTDSFTGTFTGLTGIVLVIKAIGNTVLAATDKGKLWFYDINGDFLHVLDVTCMPITSLCISKPEENSDLIYIGSLDTTLRICDFQAKQIMKAVQVDEKIQCMEISWGYCFLGSDRGYLVRYNISNGKIEYSEKISDSNVLVLKATREGTRKVLLVATRNSAVSVRDAMSGLYMRTMETPFFPTVYTLLLEDNLVYCGTSQHDILVYTFQDGQLVFKHEAAKSKGVVCMQIVGKLLFAGCYNGNIYVYNIKTNDYLGTMKGPGGLLLCMNIVNDKIVVGTKTNNFKAWQIPKQFLELR